MPDKTTPIDQTKKWLSNVILKLRLCPFAKQPFDNDQIHYDIIETADLQSILERIMQQCAALDQHPARETSLLICPNSLATFETYLDMLEMANGLLEQQGYEGVYQLASFHPDYRFADSSRDDPANYTNRSPYPMVHILREASIEAALENFPNPEDIPERNIKVMRELGLEAAKTTLADCSQ